VKQSNDIPRRSPHWAAQQHNPHPLEYQRRGKGQLCNRPGDQPGNSGVRLLLLFY
jgi:hypothetical protein